MEQIYKLFTFHNFKLLFTNDDVYTLLNLNEYKFNSNQINGLKYQLLKTIVRKESKIYKETDLIPEYLLKTNITKALIMNRINANIKNINLFVEQIKSPLLTCEDVLLDISSYNATNIYDAENKLNVFI